MSDGTPTSNVIGIRDVYDAVGALRNEQATRFTGLEQRIDRVESRQDRNDGAIALIRWFGPTSLAALVLGFLVIAGVIHTA